MSADNAKPRLERVAAAGRELGALRGIAVRHFSRAQKATAPFSMPSKGLLYIAAQEFGCNPGALSMSWLLASLVNTPPPINVYPSGHTASVR